jgi:hypothetical protein
LEDRPKQIKVEIFPGDNVDCESAIQSLAVIGMLTRYEVGGRRYIQITNFVKHQNPHCKEPILFPAEHATNNVAMMQAPSQHKAETVQPPCKPGANTIRATLNPESLLLNPESPLPITESPLLNPESKKTDTPSLPREAADEPTGATRQGAVCVVLKSEGISQVNPGHPDLLELLEAGAQLSDFVAACEIASGANKLHFGYVLGIVRRRLEDAKKPAKKRQKNSSNAEREIQTFKERDERRMRKNWEEQTGREHPDNIAEREAAEPTKTVTSKTVWQPLPAPRGVPA